MTATPGKKSNQSHGKGGKRRVGVHKNARSPEILRWQRELLAPERPEWMPQATYAELLKLRSSVGTA
jgi:hypothetical protein